MDFDVGQGRVTVNTTRWTELETRVEDRLARGEGFALATLNLDHLVKLAASDTFRKAYAEQDFVVADGNPIVWMSRLAGRPLELIPGSDAILPLSRIAARQGVAVALVGATDEVLDAAAEHLERSVPGLSVVCKLAPPMGFQPDGPAGHEVLRQIEESGARLCFVAMGAVRQEVFAAEGRSEAPGVGFVSIGAGLDFFAGAQQRAPAWIRRLALEWVWRIATDPGRMVGRYARCIAILPRQALRALAQRRDAT